MPHIAPICLPEKNEDFMGKYGWAAGWGALQAGKRKIYGSSTLNFNFNKLDC